MLKTTLAAGVAVSAKVRNKKQDNKRILMDRGRKKPAQKSCKSQLKNQKRLNLKSGSKQKKQKRLELRTLVVNQDHFLPLTLVELLPN